MLRKIKSQKNEAEKGEEEGECCHGRKKTGWVEGKQNRNLIYSKLVFISFM